MTNKVFVIVTIMSLLTSHIAFAQKKVYSLEQIWQKTLQQYPSLSSGKNKIEQQELQKTLIKKERLPEVNFQGQQSYGSYQGVGGSFFPLPGIYNTSGSDKSLNGQPTAVYNLSTSAVAQWNFIQFGKIKTKLNVADAAIQISHTVLSQEELRLQIIAARQYFAVLQSSALLTISKTDVQRLEDLFQLSKAQANAGLRAGADTLLVKSNYYQIKGQVNEQQALLETAMMQVASLIGEDENSFTMDTSLYSPKGIAADLPGADSLNNHPYLQYLKANILYANTSLEAVKRLPYPSAGLLAGAGIRGSGMNSSGIINNSFPAPWKSNTAGYLIGVGVTWNLSSLYQNKVKQKLAEKEIQAVKADYEVANLTLNAAYNTAVSRWKQQRQKVIDSRIALIASQQAYDLYVTRYESGLINLIELLQLQKTLQNAEKKYVEATGAYWAELINQSESTGNLLLLPSQLNHY